MDSIVDMFVVVFVCRVLKAQSDHRSRHEGKDFTFSDGDHAKNVKRSKLVECDSNVLPTVTHYSMWLLVSWAHCSSTVKSSLADSDHLHDWLKKLTLLIPEVSLTSTAPSQVKRY